MLPLKANPSSKYAAGQRVRVTTVSGGGMGVVDSVDMGAIVVRLDAPAPFVVGPEFVGACVIA